MIAALKALAAKKKPIILIAGGGDKELAFTEAALEVQARVKNIILFSGKATEKLKVLLPETFPLVMASNMQDAVHAAVSGAKSGDIILLSPGATSFGIFKNEYDRGDQFKKIIDGIVVRE